MRGCAGAMRAGRYAKGWFSKPKEKAVSHEGDGFLT